MLDLVVLDDGADDGEERCRFDVAARVVLTGEGEEEEGTTPPGITLDPVRTGCWIVGWLAMLGNEKRRRKVKGFLKVTPTGE